MQNIRLAASSCQNNGWLVYDEQYRLKKALFLLKSLDHLTLTRERSHFQKILCILKIIYRISPFSFVQGAILDGRDRQDVNFNVINGRLLLQLRIRSSKADQRQNSVTLIIPEQDTELCAVKNYIIT